MSTRKAKDPSVFYQSRYASNPEFERGLLANLVAKRCALLNDKADRELLWFIQHLSHQDGGLSVVVKELCEKYGDRIQTNAMAQMKLKRGHTCSAAQVKLLRSHSDDDEFILKGEILWCGRCRTVQEILEKDVLGLVEEASIEMENGEAKNHPSSYPSDKFFSWCLANAQHGLEEILKKLCLDPESSLTDGPWYFPRLIETLHEFKTEFVKQRSVCAVITSLGKKVCDTLDYTSYSRGLTLMQGEARTGKSFAARAWCNQHPGMARFVEVPPSNDETSFFRAIASGLGLGNFINYKACEVRARVESVLRNGDILLVLDEAQRLWPQRNLRYGFPGRIVWVMSMANAGIPIAMISTPQFVQIQKAVEKTGWNSAQLTGRISHYESLPPDLSPDDLMAVAKTVLPEASEASLRALAVYARSSARYLAAIETISKRARYIAMKSGRATASTEDVRKAMQESVIPADTKLHIALAAEQKSRAKRVDQLSQIETPIAATETAPAHADQAGRAHMRSSATNAFEASPRTRRNEGFEAPLISA